MWLFLWVLFVLAIIGFFLWSYQATYEQKRTWKAFASRHNLLYQGGRMMDSPTITGLIKDYEVNFYPMLMDNAVGQQNKYTIVEIFLNKQPDCTFAVTSRGFMDYMNQLDLPVSFKPDNEAWPASFLSRSYDEDDAKQWFDASPDHIQAMKKLKQLPMDIAFIAPEGGQAFVALRSQNALSKLEHLNKIMKLLLEVAKLLEAEIDATAQVKQDVNNDDTNTVEETDGTESSV